MLRMTFIVNSRVRVFSLQRLRIRHLLLPLKTNDVSALHARHRMPALLRAALWLPTRRAACLRPGCPPAPAGGNRHATPQWRIHL